MTDREIRLDLARPERVGFDEAILCVGRSDAQLVEIMDQVVGNRRGVLMTRLGPEVVARFPDEHHRRLDYCPISRTAFFNRVPATPGPPTVAVVAAGSSDMPQVAEGARTLTWFEVDTESFVDVGVAGLWPLRAACRPGVVCIRAHGRQHRQRVRGRMRRPGGGGDPAGEPVDERPRAAALPPERSHRRIGRPARPGVSSDFAQLAATSQRFDHL